MVHAVLAPKTKCMISEITAKISSRWISPPATWKTVNPPTHAINKITNNMVQMLMFSFPPIRSTLSDRVRPESARLPPLEL